MHEVDGLKGANHDLELDDLTFFVASDDVDAVDVLAADFGFEFEYGVISEEDLFRVPTTHNTIYQEARSVSIRKEYKATNK